MSEMRAKPSIVTVTDAAAARVREIIANADRPVAGVRLGISKGGCAGMTYVMDLADTASPGDEVIESNGVKVLVDPKAMLFLFGTEMDYTVDKLSARFVFRNPNQTDACGCGESVTLKPASIEAADGRV